MAKKNGEQKADGSKSEEAKAERKKAFWEIIRENAQNLGVAAGIILGLRKPEGGGAGEAKLRETPDWILSAFPSLTDEDEKEYNYALDSCSDNDAVRAAELFERRLRAEKIYDEVKYRVLVVKIYREYLEQIRRPAPKDESGGRLKFADITIRNPFHEFMKRLREEEITGGTPAEIFERQKLIALDRKLLVIIHAFKKMATWGKENKLAAIIVLICSIISLPFVIYLILYFVLHLFLG